MTEYIIKIDEDKKDIMGNCPLVEKPQELVRCKVCRFYLGKGFCNRSGIHLEVNDDWFCADGVKRDGDGE